MLNSVTEILDMIGVKSVEPDVFFSIDDERKLKEAIEKKKCPVINVVKRNGDGLGQVRVLKYLANTFNNARDGINGDLKAPPFTMFPM